jgi:hypothetical protein
MSLAYPNAEEGPRGILYLFKWKLPAFTALKKRGGGRKHLWEDWHHRSARLSHSITIIKYYVRPPFGWSFQKSLYFYLVVILISWGWWLINYWRCCDPYHTKKKMKGYLGARLGWLVMPWTLPHLGTKFLIKKYLITGFKITKFFNCKVPINEVHIVTKFLKLQSA